MMTLKDVVEQGGDAIGVVCVLKDASVEELNSIVAECDKFYESEEKRIETLWKNEAFKAENFLNKSHSKLLDQAIEREKIHVLTALSEISAAAQYWLGRKRRSVPLVSEDGL